MAVDEATFRSRFPEFTAASFPSARVVSALAEARLLHDVRETATLYCAAHLLSLDAEAVAAADGGSGIVTSEAIGPRKLTYRNQASSERDVFFATTSYGRRFLALERRSPRATIGAHVIRAATH